MKRLSVVFVCILVLLAGCPQADTSEDATGSTDEENIWLLSLSVENRSTVDGNQAIESYVSIRTGFQGQLANVSLFFVDADGAVLKERELGKFSKSYERKWVNTSIPAGTRYIVPKIGKVDTPEGWSGRVKGYEIGETYLSASYLESSSDYMK